MAAGWEGWNDWLAEASRPATDQMVEALAPQPGETILELAAGAGVAGFLAASVLGGGGGVIMTDFSEGVGGGGGRRGGPARGGGGGGAGGGAGGGRPQGGPG